MEPINSAMRLRLILGKYQVTEIEKATEVAVGDQLITINVGSGVVMKVIVPSIADIHLGDILTFYTEVLTHAQPEPTSIQ